MLTLMPTRRRIGAGALTLSASLRRTITALVPVAHADTVVPASGQPYTMTARKSRSVVRRVQLGIISARGTFARVGSALLAVVATSGILISSTGTAQAAVNVPDIGYGSEGAGVACVQTALNYAADIGVIPYSDEPAIDTYFGLQTKKAVEEFQAATNNTVDGIVGPATGELLLLDMFDNGAAGYAVQCQDYIPTAIGFVLT